LRVEVVFTLVEVDDNVSGSVSLVEVDIAFLYQGGEYASERSSGYTGSPGEIMSVYVGKARFSIETMNKGLEGRLFPSG
jgi:hypothetical protein